MARGKRKGKAVRKQGLLTKPRPPQGRPTTCPNNNRGNEQRAAKAVLKTLSYYITRSGETYYWLEIDPEGFGSMAT